MEKPSTHLEPVARPTPKADGPAWWTDRHSSAWDRVKEAFERDWEQTKADFSSSGQDLKQGVADTVKQGMGSAKIPPPGVPTHPLDPKDMARANEKAALSTSKANELIGDAKAKILVTDERLAARVSEAKVTASEAQLALDARGAKALKTEVKSIDQAREEAQKDTQKQNERIREAVMNRSESNPEGRAIEKEARYGFGARMQYPATQAWDDALEAKLREEWGGLESSRTWAQSRVEIRRGWDLGAPAH